MMRLSLLAIVLAFVKCQVCKLDYYEEYSDPDCKMKVQRTPDWMVPGLINRVNDLMVMETCQVWNASMSPKIKLRIQCLTSEAAKIEQFNHQGEDPDCKYPYPSYADAPSYVAKNAECVLTGPMTYTKFFISSTTGKFEQTKNSWEIYDANKQAGTDAGDQTEEARQDRAPEATSCMVEDIEVFQDPDCTKVAPLPPMFKDYLRYQGNTEIMSQDCIYTDKTNMRGVKARAYCHDESSASFMSYNGINEDPQCLRPYPNNAVNYTSIKAKSGDCIYSGSASWVRVKITKNDYRKWEWNPEWNQLFAKPDYDTSTHESMHAKDGGEGQAFSMEGDNYSVNVNMKNHGEGQTVTTEMKFDQYFMYSIDTMGADGYDTTPPCGPDAEHDSCKDKVYSQNTCCSHVVMMDGSGKQTQSFYRCMNQQVVDAAFSFQIDGMKMSMSCSGDGGMMSAATYMNGFALLASLVSLITVSTV